MARKQKLSNLLLNAILSIAISAGCSGLNEKIIDLEHRQAYRAQKAYFTKAENKNSKVTAKSQNTQKERKIQKSVREEDFSLEKRILAIENALYNFNTDEKDRLFNKLTSFVNQILKAKNNSDPIAVLTYAHRILRNNYTIDNYLVGTIKNFLHEKKLHCHIHSLILGLIARHLGLETKYIGHTEKKYGAAHEVLQVTWKNEKYIFDLNSYKPYSKLNAKRIFSELSSPESSHAHYIILNFLSEGKIEPAYNLLKKYSFPEPHLEFWRLFLKRTLGYKLEKEDLKKLEKLLTTSKLRKSYKKYLPFLKNENYQPYIKPHVKFKYGPDGFKFGVRPKKTR
ncbi:MAG: hypothetical protein DRN95_03455 [Candidatus Hydrothermarchaeota archaeon]|nr:MAG: hypothetical protein DRN95_03455 [Candidatus Hydrothermarchaeota archaeon]